MRQKSKSSEVVTKAYLDKALDERFGSYDKKMETRFRGIDGRFKLADINTDIKLENLERKIDEKAREYRDQVLTSNDKIIRELEVMREENTIGFNQMARLNKQVINHEKRIKILEFP